MKKRTKLLSIAIVFLMGTSALSILTHQAKSAGSDPVGHWRFDEGSGNIARDISGHGNDGTITGAEWVTGISGSALRFRDSSTYVTMARFPDGLAGNTEFTVTFWVKINTWPSAQYAYLISFGATADDQAFHVLLDNDDGYGPYGTVRANFWGRHNWTQHTFSTGVWYDWAFVYDKTKVTMYQNGTFLEDISLGGAVPNLNPSRTLWVSGPNTNSTQPFDGIIDEIAVYDYARSSDDILKDYNSIIYPPTQPSWMQWWFWTNIALATTTGTFIISTVHYRNKAKSRKESIGNLLKAPSKVFKVCPNCGTNLPTDSKFCGKCGTSLE